MGLPQRLKNLEDNQAIIANSFRNREKYLGFMMMENQIRYIVKCAL